MARKFPVAVHAFFFREGQVLLLRRFNTGYEDGNFSVPAGHRKSGDERVDFFVAVERWSGEPSNCEPEKCDELRWFPRDALPANTIPYIRRALANHAKGVWFEEFGW